MRKWGIQSLIYSKSTGWQAAKLGFEPHQPVPLASLMEQMVKNLPAMWEIRVWSLGKENPLGKGRATHSNILAWEILRTEELGGLQSMGLQGLRHNWTTDTISDSKESACNAGDPSSIPRSERSSGEGHGNPLQYSCLENSMDRGAWRATVCGITKSRTRLSDWTELNGIEHQNNTMCVCESHSHFVVSNSLWPHGLQHTRLSCPWDSPGKNSGVGSHSILSGIFLIQRSNPGLLHCWQILYRLSHQGKQY